MSRKLLTVAALAAFALPVMTAQAQMGFGVAAGLSAPTGDYGKLVDAGYHATGILTFSAPLAPVGLRVEGSFNQFNYKSTVASGAKSNIVSGTANAVFSSPGIMGPYLIGGLGMYHLACSSCGNGPSYTQLGFNGGAGFKFGLSGFAAFLEARYHYVTAPSASTLNPSPIKLSFIPVSFGITF